MHQPNTSETFTPEQTAAINAFQDALPVLNAIAQAGDNISASDAAAADIYAAYLKAEAAYEPLTPDARIAVDKFKDAYVEAFLDACDACLFAAVAKLKAALAELEDTVAELEAAIAEDASISEDSAVMKINAAKSKAEAATDVLSKILTIPGFSDIFNEYTQCRNQATTKYEQLVKAADAHSAKIVENALRIALENVVNVKAATNDADAGCEVQGACESHGSDANPPKLTPTFSSATNDADVGCEVQGACESHGSDANPPKLTPTFSSRVVNFFCESAKNRNVQFGTAAVVGAAVGFGLSYVSAITTLVAGLLSVAAATIPPVAALVIVGALVGVLLALAIEFTYDKYQANNTPATK